METIKQLGKGDGTIPAAKSPLNIKDKIIRWDYDKNRLGQVMILELTKK